MTQRNVAPRLTASTLRVEARTIVAPFASAGFSSRSRASARRWTATGWSLWENDEPVPIGLPPMRGSVRQSATCVANMSWRAALSPPVPAIPTSSP